MKNILMLCFAFCILQKLWAQKPNNSVEFRGGKAALSKSIFKYLSKHNGLYEDVLADTLREGNKYFMLLMNIDARGEFHGAISILSVQDTTNVKNIIAAFKQTEGKWINHSREKKMIILPLYFIYKRDDGKKNVEKGPILNNSFYSPKKSDIISLEPIVIELHPWVT